jgi:ABC-type glycerol-3-phosphate transport system substrate-binding protein
MRISRKIAVLTSAAAIVSLALAGCSGSNAGTVASSGKTEVSFLTFTSPSITKSFWQEQVAAIEKKNPNITIKLLYTPSLDRTGYAKQLLASGQLPDVIWDAPLTDFVTAKALLPFPSSAYDKLDAPKGFGAVAGKQYNLTSGAFMMNGLYYNPAAFTAAGISTPTTFAELKAAGPKLKSAGYTPILLQSSSDAWANEFLLDGFVDSDVIAKNADWLKQRKAGKVKFDSADFRSAVKKFVDVRDAGMFNADALSLNYAQASTAWATGKYAIWPMGGWAGAVATTGFAPGVFATPGDKKVVAVSQGASLYVSSTTKHAAAAQAVAVGLATSSGYAESVMVTDGQLSVIKGGITPPKGTHQATLDTITLTKDTAFSRVWPFPTTVSGDDAPPSGWGAEYNKAIETLIGGGSVDDFVTALDAKWDSLNKK